MEKAQLIQQVIQLEQLVQEKESELTKSDDQRVLDLVDYINFLKSDIEVKRTLLYELDK